MARRSKRRTARGSDTGSQEEVEDYEQQVEVGASVAISKRVDGGAQQGPLPASDTKHLDLLPYPVPALNVTFNLMQRSAASSSSREASTGTTLWLSSQILACHLIAMRSKWMTTRYGEGVGRTERGGAALRAIELGSGTGMLALLLARLGFHTLATDVEPALSEVLRPNLSHNAHTLAVAAARTSSGTSLTPRSAMLDWTDCPLESPTLGCTRCDSETHHASKHWATGIGTAAGVSPPWSLIVTTDTLYHPPLIAPLWRTLRALVLASRGASEAQIRDEQDAQLAHDPTKRNRIRDPTVLIALERRDAALIDEALQVGRRHHFHLRQVPHRTLRKAVDAHLGATWEREAWEGVEVWSANLSSGTD